MRQVYKELFQCPHGYSLDAVVCTTMTIDASAAVNLISVAAHPESDPLNMTQDQLNVLMNGGLSEKFYFFYDDDKPVKSETIIYPEECLAPVLRRMYSVKCECVFHPKLILVRFVCNDDSSKVLWHLLVSSHNLTLSKAYEVGIVLKSQESQNINHNFVNFLSYLTDRIYDENIKCKLKQYGEELENIEFLDDNSKYKIELAVSGLLSGNQPQLFSDLYDGLNNQKDHWLIVSPPYETGEKYQKNNSIFGPCIIGENGKFEKTLPTHAKMYIHYKQVHDKPLVDQLIIGSVNCSNSGFKKNIECIARISLADSYRNNMLIQDEAFNISNLSLSKKNFTFDSTPFKKIDDFTKLSYEGINILKKVIDNYEFTIEWSITEDRKYNASVKISEKKDSKSLPEDVYMNSLKILPYSMKEENSATSKKREKWEQFKKDQLLQFNGSKDTKKTQMLRLRYDDGFSTHEVLWYSIEKLADSKKVLKNQLDEFFEKAYASLFQKDNCEVYWGEFWDQYKTFCDVYKNDVDVLNKMDEMYRCVWAARCTHNDWNTASKQLPAALDKYNGLMPYQKSAVEQAVNSFNNGKKHFLVADEAGLGKTYIAQGVIKKVFEKWKKDKADQNNRVKDTFNVAYFGSNLFLLDRTSEKLMKKPDGSVDEDFHKIEGVDRFSMIPGAFMDSNISKVDKDKINIFMLSANLIGEIAESKSKDGNDYERELKKKFPEYEDIKEFRENAARCLKEYKIINLIIIDEFHRYDVNVKTIIDMIAFDGTKVLLLSATPYNWYSSTPLNKGDFIEDENTAEQSNNKIRTFWDKKENQKSTYDLLDNNKHPNNVLDLLECDNTTKETYENYVTAYKAYKESKNNQVKVEEYAQNASKKLREYMWRNERIYAAESKRYELPGKEALSGPEWQEAISGQLAASADKAARYKSLFPGIYSFAIKKFVSKIGTKDVYKDLNYDNADKDEDNFLYDSNNRLKSDLLKKNLRTESIRRLQVEPMKQMLWLTPSRTMYQPGAPFVKNTTKLLVFSAYKMVPRGVASIFSSYVAGNITGSAASNDIKIVDESIKSIENLDEIICNKNLFPKIYDIYIPSYTGEINNLGWDEFKRLFVVKNEKLLKEILYSIGNDFEINLDVLAMYVLTAPISCLYRIFKDKADACDAAKLFYQYFKQEGVKQILARALADMPGNNGLEKLLNYCGCGCLQDMLFEFFAIKNNDFKGSLETALKYKGSTVYVLNSTTYKTGISEEEIKSDSEFWKITCRFADRFTPDGSDTGVSETSKIGIEHQKAVQEAFNSPFWPMILTTTSAGQEGIDLDSYCRRIMHYSIPSSPMAFEQRDGRIDRRMSLASRQRMTQLWGNAVCMPECSCKDYWQQLYCQCLDNSGMSPLWSMREDTDKIRIERIVPFVPQSDEELAYRKLVDLKMRYRRAFGKPDEPGDSPNEFNLKLNDI